MNFLEQILSPQLQLQLILFDQPYSSSREGFLIYLDKIDYLIEINKIVYLNPLFIDKALQLNGKVPYLQSGNKSSIPLREFFTNFYISFSLFHNGISQRDRMLINKQITIFHGSISVVWKMLLERLYYHNILILKSYSLKLIELTQSSKTIRMTYKSSFKREIQVL
ncbi:hypothetical protein pb186bvf_004939 [Paramecium bursaria]